MQNKMKGNQKIIFIYSYKYIYIYSRYATNVSQGLNRCWTRVAFVGVTCCCCRNLISILILLMVCNSLRAAVSRVRCYIWHWRSVFWFDPIISVNLCTISCCCVVVVVKQQQRRHWCCEKECDCNYYLIFACFCLYICHMFAHWHTHTHTHAVLQVNTITIFNTGQLHLLAWRVRDWLTYWHTFRNNYALFMQISPQHF